MELGKLEASPHGRDAQPDGWESQPKGERREASRAGLMLTIPPDFVIYYTFES